MQIISKKVKISTNFWKPNFLNPLCDNGYRAIVRFSENRYIFLKKLKTGTIFWENEKQVRFSGGYDFLAGQSTIFWKRYIFLESTIFWKRYNFLALPKRQGRKYGFTYAPLLEMIE